MPCYYIDPDGKTVHTWEALPLRSVGKVSPRHGRSKPVLKADIRLDDGRVLEEGTYESRIYAVHPDKNDFMRRDEEGVYHFTDMVSGEETSMKAG